MRTYFAIVCFLVLACGQARAQRLSFGDALKRKLVEYKVKAGNLANRRMMITVKNNRQDALNVELEAGRTFLPDDKFSQPFVVTHAVAMNLDKGEEKAFWIDACCGNSSASAPRNELTFSSTKMGSEQLLTTLQLMDKHKVVSHSLYQNVIWHFTNKHQIASVFAHESDSVTNNLIMKTICTLENIRPSWYSLKYAAAASGDAMDFSGIPESIQGRLEFINPSRENLQVELTDISGKVINALEMFVDYPAGNSTIPVALNVSDLPKGTYFIRVVNEKNRVLKDWEIDIG
jgi:hypothetical protein